jgi:hypothetical protein
VAISPEVLLWEGNSDGEGNKDAIRIRVISVSPESEHIQVRARSIGG